MGERLANNYGRPRLQWSLGRGTGREGEDGDGEGGKFEYRFHGIPGCLIGVDLSGDRH